MTGLFHGVPRGRLWKRRVEGERNFSQRGHDTALHGGNVPALMQALFCRMKTPAFRAAALPVNTIHALGE